jgi:hypothetical protein
MSDIKALTEINYVTVFLGVFVLLFAAKGAISLGDWFCQRFKIKTQKIQDHELLVKTSENLLLLQEKSEKDDRSLECALETFMDEVRDSFDKVNKKFEESEQKQIQRKEQSLEIQRNLTNSIKELVNVQRENGEQISALMCGSKELLGNTIDERYARYIELGGIPQSEVDDFDDIYAAYRGLNGNHGRQTKYEYVKNNLPVIPTKITLVK